MANRKEKARAANFIAVAAGLGAGLFALILSLDGNGATPNNSAKLETAPLSLKDVIAQRLQAQQLAHATIAARNHQIIITGDAPDARTRAQVLDLVVAVINDARGQNAMKAQEIAAVHDMQTISGQVQYVAPIAAAFLNDDARESDCQRAFDALLLGHSINFDLGSAQISAQSGPLLEALAATAQKCASFNIAIEGHTDSNGDAAANLALSERRAQAVADDLVRRSVSARQLSIVGYGETKPLMAGASSQADAANRRIVFVVAPKAAEE